MIKELIQFMKSLDKDFGDSASKPSKGLHIMVDVNEDGNIVIDNHFYYNGTDDLKDSNQRQVLFYEKTCSSFITINKQQKFDKKQKIHSASPFSFAFNFSLGADKKKPIEEALKVKIQKGELINDLDLATKNYKIDDVKTSIKDYFINAKKLCFIELDENQIFQLDKFEEYCGSTFFDELRSLKMEKNISKTKDKIELKDVSIFTELKEKDYVRVYLKSIPNDIWQSAYAFYYETEYPTQKLKDSDFITTYNGKKPFLMHKTAPFETNLQISGSDAKILKDFKDLLSAKPKIVPNPLPIFIFKEELQRVLIGLFKADGKLGYKELIEKLWDNHKEDFNNYYLINWYVGKDIVFQDFDFVSKFEYEFDAQIENLFEVWDKEKKAMKSYPKIKNVFDLETQVFHPFIQSRYKTVEYFTDLKEIKKEAYENLDNRFLMLSKYRRSIYNFVFKSQRQSIDLNIFKDMVFSCIKDDLTQNNGIGVKEKLNIWFSLYDKFNSNNQNNISTMASNLKKYQNFVAQLAVGEADFDEAKDVHFAFAAGQVIEYVIQKSKTDNKSYQLLEPYLQQSKCTEFKKAIASDIARYKHAINDNETRFKAVCAFVQTWETDQNMKDLLPEILAGIFAKNQFFTISKSN